MITQTKQPPTHKVTGAKTTARGLFVCIEGFWPRIDGPERYFNEGAIILLDDFDSGNYFAESYIVHYDGDPKDSASPNNIPGGTTDPVVICIVERWLLDTLPDRVNEETPIPVPTFQEASAELQIFRSTRRAIRAATGVAPSN